MDCEPTKEVKPGDKVVPYLTDDGKTLFRLATEEEKGDACEVFSVISELTSGMVWLSEPPSTLADFAALPKLNLCDGVPYHEGESFFD